MKIFRNDWEAILTPEMEKPYYRELRQKLIREYKNYTIFPDMYDIFNALHASSFADTKVIIVGQDPYHEVGQAHGLSFSVKRGTQFPPSLLNIFKELNADLGIPVPTSGDLTPWAKQGVLLLNSVLTVREHYANSHKSLGWETFTDFIIRELEGKKDVLAYVLWGRQAQAKKTFIDNPNHLIVESSHPSPLSANYGFFGSRPFSKVNAYLERNGVQPIDWQLE